MTKASLTTFDSSQIRATNRDGGAAPVARRKTSVLHKQRGTSQPLFAMDLSVQALSLSLSL
ncbi:hypothetical protein DY000_02010596 [Brassica cretica]|uniref:Uncharacterized protein n=1 Tax=Brassica cretica TaxID=69181 RepID=A0ABQ7CEV6_BRACR|nr:hypothetical protein DY000_02010596 [Brassica cretica]